MPLIFDLFTEKGDGTAVGSLPNPSTDLAAVLTGGDLFFDGPVTTGATQDGKPARLYAPLEWNAGSSYSHLDEDTYAPGSTNALMTPFIAATERLRMPGPITLGVLADQGWTLRKGALAANALRLTSVCSDDPAQTRRWRLTNITGTPLQVTWDLYGTNVAGSVTAAPGTTLFESAVTDAKGPNTVRVFADGVPVTVKASGGARC